MKQWVGEDLGCETGNNHNYYWHKSHQMVCPKACKLGWECQRIKRQICFTKDTFPSLFLMNTIKPQFKLLFPLFFLLCESDQIKFLVFIIGLVHYFSSPTISKRTTSTPFDSLIFNQNLKLSCDSPLIYGPISEGGWSNISLKFHFETWLL